MKLQRVYCPRRRYCCGHITATTSHADDLRGRLSCPGGFEETNKTHACPSISNAKPTAWIYLYILYMVVVYGIFAVAQQMRRAKTYCANNSLVDLYSVCGGDTINVLCRDRHTHTQAQPNTFVLQQWPCRLEGPLAKKIELQRCGKCLHSDHIGGGDPVREPNLCSRHLVHWNSHLQTYVCM